MHLDGAIAISNLIYKVYDHNCYPSINFMDLVNEYTSFNTFDNTWKDAKGS